MGIGEEGPRHVQQAVGFDDAIGIDHAEQGITRQGGAGIDGIGAASVVLGDKHEVGKIRALVDSADLPRLDTLEPVLVHRPQAEMPLQDVDCLVG